MNALMSQDGKVTVPKRVRQRLGLEPGAKVAFVLNDLGEVVLRRDAPTSGPSAAPAPAKPS